MGLAVLPARLKGEMAALADVLVSGGDLRADEALAKHADWAEELQTRYAFTRENVTDILEQEIGQVFAAVLEHAGVYKCCLLYTSPSPRDLSTSRMPSSA